MKLLTARQMRSAEAAAASLGLGAAELVRRAAAAAAAKITADCEPCAAVTVCGKGNNGADGLRLAVLLGEAGFDSSVVMACDFPESGLARAALEDADRAGLPIIGYYGEPDAAVECISDAEVLADAVFGTGFSEPLSGDSARLIGIMNSAHCRKYALDIPSGCCADSARADENAFRADCTVVFGAYKPCHFICPAAEKCGELEFCDIGIPAEAVESFEAVEAVDAAWVRSRFPKRRKYSYKGDYGRVLVVAGQPGMSGAAKLAARGASAGGAGLVELCTDRRIAGALAADLTVQLFSICNVRSREPMGYGEIDEAERAKIVESAGKADAAVIGCGLGRGRDRAELIFSIAENTDIPILLDADGLNSVAGGAGMLAEYPGRFILTPHLGEFSRLCDKSVMDISADKLETAREFALSCRSVLLLKGADTIVTDGERTAVVTAGSPAMAKGGSGDLLSGVIGGLLAQDVGMFEAAAIGAWCCGKAGEAAAAERSATAADATDTLAHLGEVFLTVE